MKKGSMIALLAGTMVGSPLAMADTTYELKNFRDRLQITSSLTVSPETDWSSLMNQISEKVGIAKEALLVTFDFMKLLPTGEIDKDYPNQLSKGDFWFTALEFGQSEKYWAFEQNFKRPPKGIENTVVLFSMSPAQQSWIKDNVTKILYREMDPSEKDLLMRRENQEIEKLTQAASARRGRGSRHSTTGPKRELPRDVGPA